MNVEPVNELVALHLRKRLQLVTAETPPGIAIIQGDPDPDVLVAELLQLALFGAHVREMAAANPNHGGQGPGRQRRLQRGEARMNDLSHPAMPAAARPGPMAMNIVNAQALLQRARWLLIISAGVTVANVALLGLNAVHLWAIYWGSCS